MVFGGCCMLPEISRQPTVQNPFPQLSRVAVAPLFNHSAEPSVDGRQFALAYFTELQAVPGFEVVPLAVVERAMQDYGLTLAGAADARKLAQVLEVDAVVVGAVTDFSPYYPPRCALQVEWYAANPGFHPIPAGYGLPWSTPQEEEIPAGLVFEAEMALAREQMRTQTPHYETPVHLQVPPEPGAESDPQEEGGQSASEIGPRGREIAFQRTSSDATGGVPPVESRLPPDWPDPRGFTPPGPLPAPPPTLPSDQPVLVHTKAYSGHDSDFTTALETYVYFRDDARFGGWQSYLQRSDDFIRFCCHVHIAEMLTARGGAGETRVVWRWPTGR